MLDDDEVKWLILDLLKSQSERDKQRLIGPSEIGNQCEYHLALRLLSSKGDGKPKPPGEYWLGAKIGTAIHAELEQEERKHLENGKGKFRALKGAMVEESMELGTIEGYGTVRLKPDLVLVSERHLVDHKTTSKTKLAHYKLDGIPFQYVVQQNLYAWGLNKNGVPIERISLSFINREGTSDRDINIFSMDYDEQIALDAWARLEKMWQDLQNGLDPETLESAPDCYECKMVLHRI